jgi:hypothetical protein
VESPFIIKSWVSFGGLSDHMLVMFIMVSDEEKPPSPLKFNHIWLLEEDFKKLVEDLWVHITLSSSTYMFQFVENIAKVKEAMRNCIKAYNEKSQASLKEVEFNISKMYEDNAVGSLSESDLSSLSSGSLS